MNLNLNQLSEDDTCRLYIVPALQQVGWENEPHAISGQLSFTDGRIIPAGKTYTRKKGKRLDYLLRYRRDFPLAVVEAKAWGETAGSGLQQAKEYAEILGLKFAYASNGQEIIEFDYFTGIESILTEFPSPESLWARYQLAGKLTQAQAQQSLTPFFSGDKRTPRYYQTRAINAAVEAILAGQKRMLITMATGTGKTVVAFQICWKLWNARWNRRGEPNRRPKILFLADRNILVDDPKDKTFAPFGDARRKIEQEDYGEGSREMYFAIYQSLAGSGERPPFYRQIDPEFFDLIIVDECHRGSARDDSSWREILDYFKPSLQLGMTATPFSEESRNTYEYFGKSLFTYSLRQGIEDGFLAPYTVHRVVSQWDAAGWRPSKGQLDRYGQVIPDEEYGTKDFERVIALRARTEAIARNLTRFMANDRFAKTIVFCVDQDHADEMRRALANLNSDLVAKYPDYACRVTADEGDIGRGHLSRFQDIDEKTPVILTSSQMLTTGVDAPNVRNIVLARVVGSLAEFKQIIGRGTRLCADYGKMKFNIIDYTGSATRQFADPKFDGDPEVVIETTEEPVEGDEDQKTNTGTYPVGPSADPTGPVEEPSKTGGSTAGPREPRRKYYVDGGRVEISAHLVYILDPDGKQLSCVSFKDFSRDKVRELYTDPASLRARWQDPDLRQEIEAQLLQRGLSFDQLAEELQQTEADPFDMLCHLAFNAPLLTRRERARKLRSQNDDFFLRFGPEARQILNALLDKYAHGGLAEIQLPEALKADPLNQFGNSSEIAKFFGGATAMRDAILELQRRIYVA